MPLAAPHTTRVNNCKHTNTPTKKILLEMKDYEQEDSARKP